MIFPFYCGQISSKLFQNPAGTLPKSAIFLLLWPSLFQTLPKSRSNFENGARNWNSPQKSYWLFIVVASLANSSEIEPGTLQKRYCFSFAYYLILQKRDIFLLFQTLAKLYPNFSFYCDQVSSNLFTNLFFGEKCQNLFQNPVLILPKSYISSLLWPNLIQTLLKWSRNSSKK